MVTCATCGTSGRGRFCSACGADLQSTGSGPRIIGVEPAAGSAPTAESVGAGSRLRTVLVVAAVIIGLGAMMGAVGRAGGGDDDSIAESENDRDSAGARSDQVGTPSTVSDASDRTATTEPSPYATVEPDGEHWLGDHAGWFVLVSTSEGLGRIDLDTGEITQMGTDLVPLVSTGSYVVLRNPVGELVALRPSAFQGEPFSGSIAPTTSARYPSRSRLTVSDDPGRVWVDPVDWTLAGVEVDLETGGELRRVTRALVGQGSWGLSSPQFTSPVSGGIYRLDDSGTYQWVREGAVIAEGFGRMLVADCTDQLDCGYRWLDASTFEPLVDLAVPDQLVPLIPLVLASGRVVSDGGSAFLDIETGETFEVLARETSGLLDGWAQISPDARFIASTSGGLVVRGIHSRVEQRLELDMPSQAIPVFIPKPAPEAADAR